MKRVWWKPVLESLAAAMFVALGASGLARAEEFPEVDCASLENIKIAGLAQYDFTSCAAEDHHGRATEGPVSSSHEMLIAVNRATFVALRYLEANRYTYFDIDSVADFVPNVLEMPMRNWGDQRQHGRFIVAPVEVKISDDSPYLSCFGYVSRWGAVALAPGYKFGLGGLYCALDTLTPTDREFEEFLDGVEF